MILISLVKKGIKYINSKTEPHLTTYREDEMYGIQWEWSWVFTGSGYSIQANTPVPFCKGCKGNLVGKEEYGGFRSSLCLVCENCGFKKNMDAVFVGEVVN